MSNCPALITRSLWPSPVMKTTEALKSGCIISTIKMLVFVSEWSTLICTVLDHDKEPLTITSDGDKALKRGCIICWIKMLPQHRPQTVSPSTVMKAEHSSVPAQLVATQVYFPSWFILALLIFSLTFSSSCHVFMLGDRTSSRPFLNSEPRNNTAAWWVYACTANHHSQQPFFSDWEWARSLWAWCFEAYWCCLYKRAKYNIATPNFHARNAVIILYQTCCYLCHWMAKPRKNDGANCRITWRRDKTEERKRNKTEERPVNVNGWTWRMWRWVLITLSPKSASKHFEVLRKSWWMNLSRKRKAKKKNLGSNLKQPYKSPFSSPKLWRVDHGRVQCKGLKNLHKPGDLRTGQPSHFARQLQRPLFHHRLHTSIQESQLSVWQSTQKGHQKVPLFFHLFNFFRLHIITVVQLQQCSKKKQKKKEKEKEKTTCILRLLMTALFIKDSRWLLCSYLLMYNALPKMYQ